MEEGSLRCDANVSLRPRGRRDARHQGRDQEHELLPLRPARARVRVRRQARALDAGERIVQETRLWDPERARTAPCAARSTRTTIATSPSPTCRRSTSTAAWVEAIRAGLPELPRGPAPALRGGPRPHRPRRRAARPGPRRSPTTSRPPSGRTPSPRRSPTGCSTSSLRELPGDDDRAIAACPIAPARLAGLLALIEDGTISGKIAKDVFEKMYRTRRGRPHHRRPRRPDPGRRRGRARRGGRPGAGRPPQGRRGLARRARRRRWASWSGR